MGYWTFMKDLFLITWIISAAFFPQESLAQRWTSYSTINGLAGNNVNDILVDQNGILWFATLNGISSFDGKWKAYLIDEGLEYNIVNSIVQDNDGNIWFGTQGGIIRIDPASNLDNPSNWTKYTVHNTNNGLSNNHITCMVIDNEGKFWFGTNGGGISVVDPTPNLINPSKDPLRDPENWKTFTTEDGLTSNILYRFNTSTDQWMEIDADGNIWAIAGSTIRFINIYTTESGQWNTFDLPSMNLRALFKDSNGN